MNFQIKRTSEPYDEVQPCEGAFELEETNSWDNPMWGIKINSLTELLDFKNKVEHPITIDIAFESEWADFSIEICDIYNE